LSYDLQRIVQQREHLLTGDHSVRREQIIADSCRNTQPPGCGQIAGVISTAGNARVKAWFERYLTVIYFYKGDYLKCLKLYEKSLSIPEEEQDWLSRHCVGAYAAKAYQVTGQEEKAIPLMEAELYRLRHLGIHEELSLNYLMYAEILLAEEMRKISLGGFTDFTGVYRYLELAEEHAVLNRSAGDYMLFARILRLGAELLSRPEKSLYIVKDILRMAENATPFFQTLAYGRVANALHMLGQDMDQSRACYLKSIEIGERHGTMSIPMIACGELAAIFLREGNEAEAEEYTRRFLELSIQYERIYADLWAENEGDVTGMFHTRRGEIRRAFESLGAKNPIMHEKGIYRLEMEEIICDHDAFRQAAEDFRKSPSPKNAQKVVDYYTGRYLDDLEALWTESARLRCEDTFLQAAETLLESYRESGERAKTVELLRRCAGLGRRRDQA